MRPEPKTGPLPLSRRGVLRAGLGGAVAAATLPGPAQAETSSWSAGPRSRLPWHHGVATSKPGAQATLLQGGREWDVLTVYHARDTLADLERVGSGKDFATRLKDRPERLSISLAMFPKGPAGFWPRDEEGDVEHYDRWAVLADPGHADAQLLDASWVKMARSIKANFRRDTILRPAWEFNGRDYPWSCTRAEDAPHYIACWRRLVGILRNENPDMPIDWCALRRGRHDGPLADFYPGDGHVDVIGCDYYDLGPRFDRQEKWDRQYGATHQSSDPTQGPWGLGAWLAFAGARGKPFSVPEWGLAPGEGGGPVVDNPLFIENMHRFFSGNSERIAYACVFQLGKRQMTDDGTPAALAAYRALFG